VKRGPRDRYPFVFAADVEPVLEVEPGEEVVFETLDSWTGRLTRPEDIHVKKPDYSRSNPAAGPVFVRGAQPGDALAVDVLAIAPHSLVISKVTSLCRVLAGEIGAPHCRFVPVEGLLTCFATPADRFSSPPTQAIRPSPSFDRPPAPLRPSSYGAGPLARGPTSYQSA
jgi:acetamidase/formamidase